MRSIMLVYNCEMQKCIIGNVNSVYKIVSQLKFKSKMIKLRQYMCGRTTLVSMKITYIQNCYLYVHMGTLISNRRKADICT